MLLTFETPKKLRNTKKHNDMNSSDCGIPGTYVPNMSEEDEFKWKGKKVGGDDPRVEIRKRLGGTFVVITVRPDEENLIEMSANGRIYMDCKELEEFNQVIDEALEVVTGKLLLTVKEVDKLMEDDYKIKYASNGWWATKHVPYRTSPSYKLPEELIKKLKEVGYIEKEVGFANYVLVKEDNK